MKDKLLKWGVILLILMSCLYLSISSTGRYQIVETQTGTFLLDTRSGDTWRRVVINTKDRDGLLTTYWSPDLKFDDEQSENTYVGSTKSNEAKKDKKP